jgi:hypothetical protein
MADDRHNKPGNPADRLGDTTKSHGPLGQGSSDVLPASQNLSGMGKSQAPASGTGNSTSAASPSGPRPLKEQREAGSFGQDGVQSSGNQNSTSPGQNSEGSSKANRGGRQNNG